MRYLDDFSDYDALAEIWASWEESESTMQELDCYLTDLERQSVVDDLEETELL